MTAKLKRLTLAEQAYEELQALIVSGSLGAGERLFPNELAEQLSISQTPVKEALAALERDGLVQAEARRASTVRRFTTADLVNIYQARTLLELHALKAGSDNQRITPAFLDRLGELFEAIVLHTEKHTRPDLARAVQLDCDFHELLVSLAGNPIISGWHRTIMRQCHTARNYTFQTYPLASTRAGHSAILEAMRDGDWHGAERALRRHLEGARDEMLARPASDRPVRT